MIPQIFGDRPVAIVAGGPSLSDFPFDELADLDVVAINRALRVCPTARVLWWSDHRFFEAHRDEILAHPAPFKATAFRDNDRGEPPPEIIRLRFTGLAGFDPDPGCLKHGNNSGYAAIHLAVSLGAKQIVLLGYDMRHGAGGVTHWHGGYGLLHRQETLTDQMLPHFRSLVAPLAERGVQVINANPESALTIWPRMSFRDARAAL